MADTELSRLTIAFPKDVTKALRMKAISDECSPSDVIVNALMLAYTDDHLLAEPLEKLMDSSNDSDNADNNNDTTTTGDGDSDTNHL